MRRDSLHISTANRWRAEPRAIELTMVSPVMAGVRAVFVTDVHHWRRPRYERSLELLLDLVQAQRPDLILWGGDYAEDGGHLQFFERAARLSAPMGMYAVIGNNDIYVYQENERRFRDAAGRAGIQLLVNESLRIAAPGGSLLLVGLDDAKYGRPDLRALDAPAEPDEYRILLSHSPLGLRELRAEHAALPQLILCGHTHGGQLNLGPLSAYSIGYERARGVPNFYVRGDHTLGTARLIVSGGIGMSNIPLRVGAPPEIHCINFHKD